jgi:predicted  nucleic acid-binding Zn-ribbon protein
VYKGERELINYK